MEVLSTKPIGSPVSIEDIDIYIKMCSDLGIPFTTGLQLELDSWLNRNAVPVYDRKEVTDHMNKLYGDKWGWYPIKKYEISSLSNIAFRNTGKTVTNTIYTEIIPFTVLQLMHKLNTDIPKFAFYVACSDDQVKPDPFLIVGCVGITARIIACWNEPTFTGNPT